VKLPLIVCGVFFVVGLAAAAPAAPPTPEVRSVAGWLSGLGERREGSAAEALVFDTLYRWFSPRAAVKRSGFADQDGEHSFSQRLWFRVAGPRPGELVLVIPTDGANHRGVAWAAAWADEALKTGTPVSLTFLFTGAERGAGESEGLGSRVFLQDFYPTEPAAVLYLDAGESDAVKLTAESGVYPSPLWMVRGLSEALNAQKLVFRFTGTAPSLFRLDLPERRNALEPWFARSIPALLVGDGPADERMVRALQGFTAALSTGVPDVWDRHWLAFDFGVGKIFWDQQTYLVIYLTTVVILLFGYASLGRRHRGSLKVLGQGFWQLPVLLAFGFLALEAGTALSTALQASRGQSELWKQAPLLVWSFKGLVAVTLYIFLFLPFRRTPLSRDPDFYGQAALLWLGAMTLASTVFELSFSFYFLWALVWSAVLLVAPWRPVKLIALSLGPVWLVKAAFDVLGPQPDLELSRWVLASPLAGNFVLDLLFFPFLLQVNAWHFSGHRHQNRNEGLRALLQLAGWVLLTLGTGLALLRIDAPPPLPAAVERVDQRGHTRILQSTGQVLPYLEGLWTTTVTHSAFLDRTVWSLRFDGSLPPDEVDLELVSEEPLTIFDCSFPLVLDPSGQSARIVIGRQPPLPLGLRLTLPQGASARLLVRAVLEGERRVELSDEVKLSP
jgi:hypothetical protein